MPARRPYRSRLFQHVHHQSQKTVRRAQRAWREITSAAAWGAKAVTYSLNRLWHFVQSSHLQMPAVPRLRILQSSAEKSATQTAAANAPSKAVVRVLSYARTVPYLADSLHAPRLTAAPKQLAVSPRSHPELQSSQTAATSTSSLTLQPEDRPAVKKLRIRAIASQLVTRQLVLVTPQNTILDCLTKDQKSALAQRIATELDYLATIPHQTQLAVQPRTWQQSIDRLVFPARRLRQLPEATQHLLQSSVKTCLRLAKSIPDRPLASAWQELAKQIPIPNRVPHLSSQLALPPARELVEFVRPPLAYLTSPLAHLTSMLASHWPTAPSKPSYPQNFLPSVANALSWKHLQHQIRVVWHSEASTSTRSPISPWSWTLAALPVGRTQWATNFLKPFHRKPQPNIGLQESDPQPILPPSPPQLLLQPPTIGFLRPAAKNFIRLHRTPPSGQVPVEQSIAEVSPTCRLPMAAPTNSLMEPEVAAVSTAVRPPKSARKSRTHQPSKRGSSLQSKGKQRHAPTNTYIDVEAKDLGYDTSALSQGVDWLDRGVYAIEESALKAWQWWCDLVEPEGAPKPVNLRGIPHEGRALLAASTHRSQAIATASAELGVALFQELWPLMWHFMQVLAKRGSKLAIQVLQWLLSVALPIASRLVSTLVQMSLEQLWKLLKAL